MIPTATFGRTGHVSTRIIFGAAALGGVTQAEADTTVELLQQYGINHFDTAASYGESEIRLGSWISRHGKPAFLATKTGERTAAKALEELQRSLERLHVDHVDLWQLHYLVDPEEWRVAMGEGGALEAALEARRQGLVRFIGVTGHDIVVAERHLSSLERFDFDSVLLPFSYILMQNEVYQKNVTQLRAACKERSVAVQTIKGVARAPWGDRPHTRATWYEPFEAQEDIDLAVHYVLAHPDLFLNTAGDIHILPKILDAASRFSGMPDEARLKAQLVESDVQPLFT